MIRNKMKSENFNDGSVAIYSVENAATGGNMPLDRLVFKRKLRYRQRTVGFSRYFTALQAKIQIAYILRCPRNETVSTLDIAVPNDNKQYRIIQIQYPEDIFPPVMDLTLQELKSTYEIGES